MRPCLEDEELFVLVDGALSDKDARVLREHLEGCARCKESVTRLERSLAGLAEEEPLDVVAHVDAVMSAIDRPQTRDVQRSSWQRAVPAIVGTLAVAAALVVGIGIGRRHPAEDFTARGGAVDPSLRRGVALTVQTLVGDVARPIAAGERIAPQTRFVASHRNTSAEPRYALVFGVDARKAVHWLYPAYESVATDPSSVALVSTGGRELLMPTAVSFDDVSLGPLTIVTIVLREPMFVSSIEARTAVDLDALRRDFPNADVSFVDVVVAEKR